MTDVKTPEIVKTLKQHCQVLEAAIVNGQSYIDIIEKNPFVDKIESGGFYQTYDGNLAMVLNEYTQCTCPNCTGRNILRDLMGALISTASINMTPEDVHTEEHDESKKTGMYKVVLLSGGHGISELRGEKPGEQYLIGEDGFAVLFRPGVDRDEKSKVAISKELMAMAGLSLRRRVKATFC